MRKTLLINGADYTNYLPPVGYEVGYEPVDGGQGGVMQSGTYTEDEIALKAVITLPCMPLTDARIATLLSEVYHTKYCAIRYYDPMRGVYRQINARRQISSQKYRGTGADSNEYWTGTVITFTER